MAAGFHLDQANLTVGEKKPLASRKDCEIFLKVWESKIPKP
jgi:hypothetical protein